MESFGPETSSGNVDLIDRLKKSGVVKDSLIEKVLKSVDRADFLPSGGYAGMAYEDCPQPIGYSATISAPHMHAYALVVLKGTVGILEDGV